MRIINIDATKNPTGYTSIFGGYAGEHNNTEIQIKLPDNLKDNTYTYQWHFGTSYGEEYKYFGSTLDDGTIYCPLYKTVTKKGTLEVQVEVYKAELVDGKEEKTFIGKTGIIPLLIKDSVEGTLQNGGIDLGLDETEKIHKEIVDINNKTAFSLGVAGFYDENNVLIKTFDKMIADGDITVTDGVLTAVSISEQGKLIISDDVTELADGVFSGRSSLIGVKIPNTVTSIPSGAFYGTSLVNVTIPDSVMSIGNAAFGHCELLTSVILGKGVTSISDGAFDNCIALSDVYYKGTKTEFDNIVIGTSNEYLKNATIHYELTDEVYDEIDKKADKTYVDSLMSAAVKRKIVDTLPTADIDENTIYMLPTEPSKENNIYDEFMYINDNWEQIGSTAMDLSDYAKKEDIEGFETTKADKTYVDNKTAFSLNVPGLYSENNELIKSWDKLISDGDITVSDNSITDCQEGLAGKLVIDDSITSIGEEAFVYCKSLIDVTIPDSITSIGNNAFSCCSSLISVKIPDTVTSIPAVAFQGCTSLKSIVIPDSVTSIGESTFCDCTSLKSIIIGNNVTSIGIRTFQGCTSLTSVIIPDNVTTIYSNAFRSCTSLTSVIIGNGVTSIGEWAFGECGSLKSITIGNSVTSIGDWTFYNCIALTSVTIGNSITSIADYVFASCSALADVYYKGTKIQWNNISIGTSNEYLKNATIHYELTDKVYDEIDTKADKTYVEQNYSNAVKGYGIGTALLFDDVSPFLHKVDLSCNSAESSGTLLDWSNVTLSGTSITISGSLKGYSSASTFDTSNDGWVSYTSTENGKESLYFWGFPTDYSSHKGFKFRAYCNTSGVTMRYGNQNNVALQKSVLLPTSAPDGYYYIDTAFLGENFGDITFYVDTKNVTVYISDIEWYDEGATPTVKIYNKNLFYLSEGESGNGFDFSGSNCKIENPTSYYYTITSTDRIKLPKGTYTFTANLSGSIDYGSATRFYFSFHQDGGTSSLHITKTDFENGKRIFSTTFTATEDFEFYIESVNFDGRTPTSANLSINLQLEAGDTATEFEEYRVQTITLDRNAQVDSISPSMVITADSNIAVTYNRDTNKVINQLLIDNENLKNAVVYLGGSL